MNKWDNGINNDGHMKWACFSCNLRQCKFSVSGKDYALWAHGEFMLNHYVHFTHIFTSLHILCIDTLVYILCIKYINKIKAKSWMLIICQRWPYKCLSIWTFFPTLEIHSGDISRIRWTCGSIVFYLFRFHAWSIDTDSVDHDMKWTRSHWHVTRDNADARLKLNRCLEAFASNGHLEDENKQTVKTVKIKLNFIHKISQLHIYKYSLYQKSECWNQYSYIFFWIKNNISRL